MVSQFFESFNDIALIINTEVPITNLDLWSPLSLLSLLFQYILSSENCMLTSQMTFI